MILLNEIIFDDIKNITNFPLSWMKFSGNTFLISGANGFLPSYMIHTLLYLNKKFSKKIKIFAIVRNKNKSEKVFSDYLQDPALKIIAHDLTKPLKLNSKIDYIIHAASQASPKFYKIDPVGTLLPNVIGTKNLLDLAVKNKIKCFLFFSSGEVYGNFKNKKIEENSFGSIDPTELRSCYAESKRMGENMCISWYNQYKVPTKIARIFHTYGPGMKLDDGRVFADFVSNVVQNKNLIVKGDGKVIRPFCYISDTTLALFTILLKGRSGESYNVSNPNCRIRIKNLAKLLSTLFPEKNLQVKHKEIQSKIYMKTKIPDQNPSIDKLLKLGWYPTNNLKEGFLRTILSYKMN